MEQVGAGLYEELRCGDDQIAELLLEHGGLLGGSLDAGDLAAGGGGELFLERGDALGDELASGGVGFGSRVDLGERGGGGGSGGGHGGKIRGGGAWTGASGAPC